MNLCPFWWEYTKYTNVNELNCCNFKPEQNSLKKKQNPKRLLGFSSTYMGASYSDMI